MAYKVGDVVVCVGTGGWEFLQVGKTYEIIEANELHCVMLKGHSGSWIDEVRFKRGNIPMQESDFRKKAIKAVVDYYNDQADSTDKNGKITADDVYVVWMVKVLQNNKAMLSTTVADGMYYEFTWNGDKNEGYLDAYKKWKNVVVREGEV